MSFKIWQKTLLGFLTLISLSSASSAATLTAAQTLSARLKKQGVSIVVCPKYVANLKSGLYTSISRENTLCVKTISNSKAAKVFKRAKKVKLVLDGKLKGSAFETLDQQEGNNGDVETGIFNEVNYPVSIFFALENADYSATYTLQVKDAIFGRTETTAHHGNVPAAGWLTWIGAGKHFFKISALPDKEANQPLFHVEMRFMDPYEGFRVSKADLVDADIKTVSCPAYLLDIYGNQLFSLNGFTCTNSASPSDAGLTAAPFNLNTGLYLAQDISPENTFGAGQGFPFRITRPTLMAYAVDDPAVIDGKTGTTDIEVKNLSTGKVVTKLHVEGTVDTTQTSLNIPGDYYIDVTTRPVDRLKYGEIQWEVALQGSD